MPEQDPPNMYATGSKRPEPPSPQPEHPSQRPRIHVSSPETASPPSIAPHPARITIFGFPYAPWEDLEDDQKELVRVHWQNKFIVDWSDVEELQRAHVRQIPLCLGLCNGPGMAPVRETMAAHPELGNLLHDFKRDHKNFQRYYEICAHSKLSSFPLFASAITF